MLDAGALENLRLAHWKALRALAERHGYDPAECGVSLSPLQEPGASRVSLDMQMPPGLADALRKEGFFKEDAVDAEMKYEGGLLLRRWSEDIPRGAEIVQLPRDGRLPEDGEYYDTTVGENVVFRSVHYLFSRDPGAVQPPPARCEQLHVDGAPTEYWSAVAWECAGCRARFFVSRLRDLRHAPCFEVTE